MQPQLENRTKTYQLLKKEKFPYRSRNRRNDFTQIHWTSKPIYSTLH